MIPWVRKICTIWGPPDDDWKYLDMNSTYNNNVQTFCNYRVQAHSGACNPISGAQRPPLTLLWLLRIEGNTVTYPKTCQTIVDLFCSVKHSNCVIVFRYFKFFRLLKKLITSSCDQTTRQRIPNLRIFIMISFSTGKLRKKTVLVQYLDFCFLFQLLKLRKIPIKNWGKQDSFSLFGGLIPWTR